MGKTDPLPLLVLLDRFGKKLNVFNSKWLAKSLFE